MVMSTQTLARAADLMSVAVLIDTLDLYDVGPVRTAGTRTERDLTLVEEDVASLVQATTLQNAVESSVDTFYSVKFERTTVVVAGQAIKVKTCNEDPSLVGKTLYLTKVSENGLALIRKAVAATSVNVDQQGTEVL